MSFLLGHKISLSKQSDYCLRWTQAIYYNQWQTKKKLKQNKLLYDSNIIIKLQHVVGKILLNDYNERCTITHIILLNFVIINFISINVLRLFNCIYYHHLLLSHHLVIHIYHSAIMSMCDHECVKLNKSRFKLFQEAC